MKKVVVTGGAGFIGRHLSKELIGLGFVVYVIDNLYSGNQESVPKGANFHNIDIRNLEQLENFFALVGDIYCIFHLAAIPNVQFSINDPIESHSVNVGGTINILEIARKYKVRRLVYSASCSAYGDQESMPLVESMTVAPKSPYALQKYFGEVACSTYYRVYNVQTVSLRYFNVYGPGQDPKGEYAMVVSKFIRQSSEGSAMTITGDGKQTRDFTYVSDVVKANILAMDSQNVGKGEVLNIGYGKNISINEIANIIGGSIEYIESRIEPRNALADRALAKKLIDWEPEIDIKTGINLVKNYIIDLQ